MIHVIPHIDQEAAGPAYSVPRLCETLARKGHDVQISCLAAARPLDGVEVKLYSQWSTPSSFAVSFPLARAIRRESRTVDIIHNHSLWSMINVATGVVVPRRGAKMVTSPRGTLSRWALSRRRLLKATLWPIQRLALDRAGLIHATSYAECLQIRACGIQRPVAVVPNGIDIPAVTFQDSTASDRTMLYLGRLHPTKGIDRLLLAWEGLERHFPEWRLLIVGRGEASHEMALMKLAESLSLQRAQFVGPHYGVRKSETYFGADALVLPTHSENFGMVVAEALAHGVPAVVGRGAPWEGLEIERCGWWIDNDVETLTRTLRVVMTTSRPHLQEMGLRGRDWMIREYGWNCVAERMITAYRWLLDGGSIPDFVRVA